VKLDIQEYKGEIIIVLITIFMLGVLAGMTLMISMRANDPSVYPVYKPLNIEPEYHTI